MFFILYNFDIEGLGGANLYILKCFDMIPKPARSVNLEYSSRFDFEYFTYIILILPAYLSMLLNANQ